jgi:hypothetical protein
MYQYPEDIFGSCGGSSLQATSTPRHKIIANNKDSSFFIRSSPFEDSGGKGKKPSLACTISVILRL